MKKLLIMSAILVIFVLSVFSLGKFFDMSVCCGATCETTVVSNQCTTEHALSVAHHIESVQGYANGILASGSMGLLAILAVMSIGGLLLAVKTDLKTQSIFWRYKLHQRDIGDVMNPFDILRRLLAQGIIGSQKNFA